MFKCIIICAFFSLYSMLSWGREFRYVTRELNFTSAQQYCLARNMSLAAIDSDRKYAEVVDFLNGFRDSNDSSKWFVWIGTFTMLAADNHYNMDCFRNHYITVEPGHPCLIIPLPPKERFETRFCETENKFVCETINDTLLHRARAVMSAFLHHPPGALDCDSFTVSEPETGSRTAPAEARVSTTHNVISDASASHSRLDLFEFDSFRTNDDVSGMTSIPTGNDVSDMSFFSTSHDVSETNSFRTNAPEKDMTSLPASDDTTSFPTSEDVVNMFSNPRSTNSSNTTPSSVPSNGSTLANDNTSSTSQQNQSTVGCHCRCTGRNVLNRGDKNFDAIITERKMKLRKALVVDKPTLSSITRQKISAPDDRVSSQSIGWMGCLLLAGVASAVVVPDILHVLKYIYQSITRK